MTKLLKNTTTGAAKVTQGVTDRIVVNFLGSILSKLPDGAAGLTGAVLIGLSWIATGVFKYFAFDDAWDQAMLQQILDWASYLGYGALGTEGVNSAMNARSPHETISGAPLSQTAIEKTTGQYGTMQDVSK